MYNITRFYKLSFYPINSFGSYNKFFITLKKADTHLNWAEVKCQMHLSVSEMIWWGKVQKERTPPQLSPIGTIFSQSAHTLVFWVDIVLYGLLRTWHSRSSASKPPTVSSCQETKLHMIHILNSPLCSPTYLFFILFSLFLASRIEIRSGIAYFSK